MKKLKAGCSTNYSPMFSVTNWVRAPLSLSGLMALRSSILWKRLMSLCALGNSQVSALASAYHFLHWRASLSICLVKSEKTLTFYRPKTEGQKDSWIILRFSGWAGKSRAGVLLIRASTSTWSRSPLRIKILKVRRVASKSLWRSKVPLRV